MEHGPKIGADLPGASDASGANPAAEPPMALPVHGAGRLANRQAFLAFAYEKLIRICLLAGRFQP